LFLIRVVLRPRLFLLLKAREQPTKENPLPDYLVIGSGSLKVPSCELLATAAYRPAFSSQPRAA